MWEKEIFIRHFSDKKDRIFGGLKKSPLILCLQKDYISARILAGGISIMVSEKDFWGRSGKEDNDMTSDLTADKERLTNERRKRKQLERVRQVERTKRRLKRGILSSFLVMVLGLGAIRWYQDRQTEDAF